MTSAPRINLVSVVQTLAGKPDQAKETLYKHPLRQSRDAIQQRGYFQTTTEFYFAVADIFVDTVLNQKPDQKWAPHYEKDLPWPQAEGLARANLKILSKFFVGSIAYLVVLKRKKAADL